MFAYADMWYEKYLVVYMENNIIRSSLIEEFYFISGNKIIHKPKNKQSSKLKFLHLVLLTWR